MPRLQRRATALAGIGALAMVAGVAVALWPSGTVDEPGSEPTDEPWPPTRTLAGGGTFQAIQAAYYYCHGDMTLKHEWLGHTDMSFGPGFQTLIIDQRSTAWIEEYYGHPIDEGVRRSMYDLAWIEEYLGHPLPDGYFVWAGHACILRFLDAPPEIMDQILATTAEDGEMTETWSDFEITWTNNGIDGPDAVVSYFRLED